MGMGTVPGIFLWCCCLIVMLSRQVVTGATLSPCGEDNTAEVVEGRSVNTFTCTGLTDGQKVDWTVLYKSAPYSAATCPAGSTSGSCTGGDLGAAFTASRVSGTESRVVIDPTVLNKKEIVQAGTLRCADQNSNEASCQMDYIVPVGGSCSIQTGTESSQFNLDGKCALNAGAKSSRNRFKCVWLRSGDGNSWQQSVVLTENNYQSGCVLTSDIPTDPGVYTYRVQLFPGRRTVTAGTVQIAKPEAPTVSGCGGEDYVRENTNVTCTCSTNAIGQPQGRLQWVKIGDSSVTKEGSYGASSFAVSQRLVRSDHQSTEFRCNVDWATDIPGATIKFNVGYPPTKVFFGINGVQNHQSVNEHQTVRFRCQKDDGRPDPSLSLVMKDNNTVLLTNTSSLNHVVVSRCEDSGQYQCTAENGMGPKVIGNPLSLSVQCSPRGPQDLGDVLFIDAPVSTTFDVTAYPAPTQVTFTFLGLTGNCPQLSAVDESQIQLAGGCQAKAGGAIYLFTCTVTVNNVTSEKAAGVYQVKVTNSRGDGLFRLNVLYKEAATTAVPSGAKYDPGASCLGLAIGVSVALGIVLIVVVIIVIWLWRRQWKLPCADVGNNVDSNSQPAVDPDDYLEPVPRIEEAPGPYESLQMADVGLRSVYSGISSQGRPSTTNANQDGVLYENTIAARK